MDELGTARARRAIGLEAMSLLFFQNNPIGVDLSTMKVCSYCKVWKPFSISALNECTISCDKNLVDCACTPVA